VFYLLRNGIYFWCLLKAFSGEVAFVGVKQMTCAFDLCLTCDLFIFEDRSKVCIMKVLSVCVYVCVWVCVCVRVRVRVRVRAYARECVNACHVCVCIHMSVWY